jgi:hypothetical protein
MSERLVLELFGARLASRKLHSRLLPPLPKRPIRHVSMPSRAHSCRPSLPYVLSSREI